MLIANDALIACAVVVPLTISELCTAPVDKILPTVLIANDALIACAVVVPLTVSALSIAPVAKILPVELMRLAPMVPE